MPPSFITTFGHRASSVIAAFQPANTYEHRWQVGDVLIWSNYSTMHRRDEFDKNTVRRMHRSQIKGTAAPVAYFK